MDLTQGGDPAKGMADESSFLLGTLIGALVSRLQLRIVDVGPS